MKEMIKQEIRSIVQDYDKSTNEMTGVANATGNIAGFDGPFAAMSKRKLKDPAYVSDDEDEDD